MDDINARQQGVTGKLDDDVAHVLAGGRLVVQPRFESAQTVLVDMTNVFVAMGRGILKIVNGAVECDAQDHYLSRAVPEQGVMGPEDGSHARQVQKHVLAVYLQLLRVDGCPVQET